jgi:alkaline phosphatase D
MSCSNYPAGYFNAYTDASRIPKLDAVVHLGDYIYEYGAGGYASANADAIGRGYLPGNDTELLTLDDYRARYAQYRGDTGLQMLHASAPFICVWDDHEIANDTWKEGAENHNPGEGDFFERRRDALQAYFEWLPIRPVQRGSREIIYRNFEYGDLVNLMMLDTRVVGRDKQLDYANYIDDNGQFNSQQFVADISDTNRTLLGFEQRAWLQNQFAVSTANWQVLGQQVLMGRMQLPAELLLSLTDPAAALPLFGELAQIKGRILAGDPSVTALERARVETVLPYNLDAWDGYAAEREVVLGTAHALGKDLVVLSGDTHNAWANNLTDLANNPVGVEFATPSVTSPGLEDYLSLPQPAWPQTEQGFQLLIDGLEYLNVGDRGYMTVTFTRDEAVADWQFVDNIDSTDFNLKQARARQLKVSRGDNQLSAV